MAKNQQLIYMNEEPGRVRTVTVEYPYDNLKKNFSLKGKVIRSILNGVDVMEMHGDYLTADDLRGGGFKFIDAGTLLERGYKDHAWYCQNFLRILPDEKRPGMQLEGRKTAYIPLNPTNIQQKYIEAREDEILKKGFIRLAVLKAGRLGMSSIAASCLWGDVHLVNGTVGAIIAHMTSATRRIFNMCKRFYDYTPSYLKPTKSYDNKTEFVFENIQNEWYSGIEVFTAGVENAARSGGYNSCLSSEVAFHKDGEARGSIVRGIQDVPGTEIVDETTANGMDPFFYYHYWQAKKGENEFTALFFPWWESDRYVLSLNERELEELMDSILSHKLVSRYGDEETEMKLYDLSPEQLNWRRWYIRNKCQGRLLKPLDYFKQEMPGCDEEAFVTTSGSVFVTNIVRLKEKQCTDPIFTGGLRYTDDEKKHVILSPDPSGNLQLWEYPDTEPYINEFALALDTMQGGYGTGDPHSLHILNRRYTPPKIVGAWRGFTETTGQMTTILLMLAKYFKNDLMINIERVGWGVSIINELLEKRYFRLMYNREEFRRTKTMKPEIVGWQPTGDNKNIAISDLADAINESLFDCPDREFWKECLTFVYQGSYRGPGGKKEFKMGAVNKGGKSGQKTFDDRVMDMAILWHTHLLMNIGWTCRKSITNEPEWSKKRREEIEAETSWLAT